jgi:hypothetical protein
VVDRRGASYEHRGDQRPKSVTLLARSVIGSSEQRNKWQGPAVGGKDAVYAGWELEPMERSAPGLELEFNSSSGWGDFLFGFGTVGDLVSLAGVNVCCPKRERLL